MNRQIEKKKLKLFLTYWKSFFHFPSGKISYLVNTCEKEMRSIGKLIITFVTLRPQLTDVRETTFSACHDYFAAWLNDISRFNNNNNGETKTGWGTKFWDVSKNCRCLSCLVFFVSEMSWKLVVINFLISWMILTFGRDMFGANEKTGLVIMLLHPRHFYRKHRNELSFCREREKNLWTSLTSLFSAS